MDILVGLIAMTRNSHGVDDEFTRNVAGFCCPSTNYDHGLRYELRTWIRTRITSKEFTTKLVFTTKPARMHARTPSFGHSPRLYRSSSPTTRSILPTATTISANCHEDAEETHSSVTAVWHVDPKLCLNTSDEIANANA